MDITISNTAPAAPSDVYSVLADVATHRRWAGEQQLRPFRLLELEGDPSNPVTVGDTWTSRGKIPMHGPGFEDRSRVTAAEPGQLFEYVTESRIARRGRRSSREATYRHRYQLVAGGSGGTRITYSLSELRSTHPLLRLAIPGVRSVTWATGVRLMAARGVRNIGRLASERAPLVH